MCMFFLMIISFLLVVLVLVQEIDVIIVMFFVLEIGVDEIIILVEVVDQDYIEDNLFGLLVDMIVYELGVFMIYFGLVVSCLVICGFGVDCVCVLINGVGLIDVLMFSLDYVVVFEVFEVECVEILCGLVVIVYGGGVIGGVVNVIDGCILEVLVEDGFEGCFYVGVILVDDGEMVVGQICFNVGFFVFNLEMMICMADDYDILGFFESVFVCVLEEEEYDDEGDYDEDEYEEEEEVFGMVENFGFDFFIGFVGVFWVGENGFIGVFYKFFDVFYGILGGYYYYEEEYEDEGDDYDDDDDYYEDEEYYDEEEVGVCIDLVQICYDLCGEFCNVVEFIDCVCFFFGMVEYKYVELEGDEVGILFCNDGWEGCFEICFFEFDFGGGSVEIVVGFQVFFCDFLVQGEEVFVLVFLIEDFGFFFVECWDIGDWGLEGGLCIENCDIEIDMLSCDFDIFLIFGFVFWCLQDNIFFVVILFLNECVLMDVELFVDGEYIVMFIVEMGDLDFDVEKVVFIEFMVCM